MPKKTSLKDIAKQVGVSTALVSYVLNDQAEEKRVGQDIALKIKAAAKALNYTPNQIARSLKIRKTNTIGVVVADINYRFTSGVTKAIEAECQRYGYTVIYGGTQEDAQRFDKLVHILVDRQVDGLILVPVEGCQDSITYIRKQEIPFVFIDRILPKVEANIITIDNAATAHRAVKQLLDHGFRRIGFISYRSRLLNLADRKQGYLAALKDAGVKPDKDVIHELPAISSVASPGTTSESPAFPLSVHSAIDKLLALSQPCDSIFFATDTLAVEGLRHINARHIRVPQDLGIVSFDQSEAFDLFYCPITHGIQPLEAIGHAAVNTLIETMKQPAIKRKIILKTGFAIGRSAGETLPQKIPAREKG